MADIISPLLQWLNAHPELSGLVTFIISAAESVAIIGTIVPGSIMMTALGTLAGAGVIPLWPTIIWAILGAIVGDGISYWMGYYFKDRLHRIWPFVKYPNLLSTGEKFVNKHGKMSVFIGRFVGPVRALVPLVAGMLGMRPLQFTIANVTSAIGWAPAYMLPGILLGAASLELPPDIAIHVILALLLIILFCMLCIWFIYKTLQLMHVQLSEWQDRIWLRLQQSKHFRSITVLLKHHDPQKTHGQLTLAFGFIITSALFLYLAWYVMTVGSDHIEINNIAYHFFRGIRRVDVDGVMLAITFLGQKQIVLPVIVALFAWLLLRQRWWTAVHVLALGAIGAGSIFVVKHIVRSIRPEGVAYNPETFSFPSGHTTLATIAYMGLAFLIATSLPKTWRKLIYVIGIIPAIIVGISRLYLGAHWFTDVLGAWLLSTSLLMLVIISYQRRAEKPLHTLGILLVSLITLMCTYSYFYYQHFSAYLPGYAPVAQPQKEIDPIEWWQQDNDLPAYRTSLFGFPSERINIEWAGEINQIRTILLKEGWSNPPARDFISTLHRITAIRSTQYLPMVSLQYMDEKPALLLTRVLPNNEGGVLLVIRLWHSTRLFKGTNIVLWVGYFGPVNRSYSWIFRKHNTTDLNTNLLFPNQVATQQIEWKNFILTRMNHKNKLVQQDILLLRPKQ